jgi:hypothetical protein
MTADQKSVSEELKTTTSSRTSGAFSFSFKREGIWMLALNLAPAIIGLLLLLFVVLFSK